MAPVRETTATTPPASEEANVPRLIPQNIALGEYIFLRIAQANPKLKTIFEIPGDFNLNFLEYGYSPLVTHEGIKLINTCNELNGAYAADGYSKAIDGLSVLYQLMVWVNCLLSMVLLTLILNMVQFCI